MRNTYRIYLRLMLRSRLVQLSYLGAAALPAFGPSLPHSSGSLAQYLNLWMGLSTLGVMLVATGFAQQDDRDRVAEVIGALPVSNAAWLTGRVAAAVTAAAAAAPLQVLAAALRGLALGGAVLAPATYLAAVLTAAATFAAAAAVGFALGLTAGRPLVPILLAFLVWVGTTFGVGILREELGYPGRWVLVFALPVLDPTWATDSWFPHGRLVALGRTYQLGQAALASAAALWLWNRSRPGGRRVLPAAAAGVVGLVLAATGLAGFAGMLAARDREMAAELAAVAVPAPADPAPGARVARYDVALDLDLAGNRLAGRAEMTVSGGGGAAHELVFALRPQFRVSAVEGAELLEQRGQFVRVRLPAPLGPGQSTTVSMSYGGRVLQWREPPWGGLGFLGNHVTPTRLLLTGNYGWYPILGAQPLARAVYAVPWARGPARDLVYNAVATHPAAEFHLQVRGAGDLPLFSNLPAAGSGRFAATAVYLLGDRLEPVQGHGIEVLAPRDQAGVARDLTRLYARQIEVLAELAPLPGGRPPRFIILPESVQFGAGQHYDLPAVMPGAALRSIQRASWEVSMAFTGADPDLLPVSNLHEGDLLGFWWPALSTGSGFNRWNLRNASPEQQAEVARSDPDSAIVVEHPVEVAAALLMADMHDFILVQSATRQLGDPLPPAAGPAEQLRQFWYQDPGGALQVLRELHALRQERPLTPDDLAAAMARPGGGR